MLPHPLGAGERLRAYATWCDAVEGNTTFYAVPERGTVESWAAQTDPGFRFLAKLPKTVTHERRLTGVEVEVRGFLDAIAPLGERARTLWIQLPGSFGPGDVGTLASFLRRMPREHGYAVEVRHKGFFEDPRGEAALTRTLEAAGAEWVPFDTVTLFQTPPTSDSERDAWSKKPRMPRRSRALSAEPIVRYLGRDSVEETVEGWGFWVETVVAWVHEGRSPTVFLHTPDNADSLTLARRFHDEVRARVPALEPLPEPMPNEPLTLF
ncbi:DUF72 domain-containing protein [Actinocorallia longicatena]|uniref:DUF72 domain-containing protein n=1 Tax=Actinocorallia longicatena TaxID=111803 RepID=A0ABP6QFB4_9ACTN